MTDAAITTRPHRAPARRERMCAATRAAMPADAMIRFTRGPGGEVIADVAGRLGGRGVWLTASRRVVEDAARRGVFARGFKRETKARPDLGDAVETALVEAAIAALAAASRAGLVVGPEELAAAAARGFNPIALCVASDSPPDGEFASNPLDLPVIRALTKTQLDLALGRPNVVHAALLAGPASITFLTCCDGLVRYRTPDDEASPVGGKPGYGTGKLERVGNLNG